MRISVSARPALVQRQLQRPVQDGQYLDVADILVYWH